MLLSSPLPTAVSINDKEYAVNTDFRYWLRFLESAKSGDEVQTYIRTAELFVEPREVEAHNMSEVVQALGVFISGANANTQDSVDAESGTNTEQAIYDYDYDANWIYGAFYQQYGIDLHEKELHLYKFIALFECLDNDTMFKKIVGFRITDEKTIKDDEQKKHIKKMKEKFRMPMSEAEKAEHDRLEKEYLAIWGED